jgi:hypothetical protein
MESFLLLTELIKIIHIKVTFVNLKKWLKWKDKKITYLKSIKEILLSSLLQLEKFSYLDPQGKKIKINLLLHLLNKKLWCKNLKIFNMSNLNISKISYQSQLDYLLEILLMRLLRNRTLRLNWFVHKLSMFMLREYYQLIEILKRLCRWKNKLLLLLKT